MRSIGLPELIVILLVALVLFGGSKIGDIGKGLGDAIRNFKTAIKSEDEKAQDKEAEEKKRV